MVLGAQRSSGERRLMLVVDMSTRCHWCGCKFPDGNTAGEGEPPRKTCCRTHKVALYKHRQRMKTWEDRPCPHPDKRRYANRGEAMAVAEIYSKMNPIPSRAYHCTCGSFHHTTKELR